MDFLKSQFSIKDYNVISFDIFDTLLYRNCSVPKDIFKLLAIEAKNRLKDDFFYTPQMFCDLRRLAEKRARETNKDKIEITLEDIYAELPIAKDIKDTLLQLEIEIECNNIVLNGQIYEFIKYCVKKIKKLFLYLICIFPISK